MATDKQVFTTEIAGQTFKVEIGEVAKQANGACLVQYGDTSVLATATASKEPRDLPFFPLMVNYEERLYAVGKIPGGFIKIGRASCRERAETVEVSALCAEKSA